jgi:hypothetical protein
MGDDNDTEQKKIDNQIFIGVLFAKVHHEIQKGNYRVEGRLN